ncbi:porin family protein [Thiohalophilus thiocyanatoxydans]|uniref:Outer membrane protein with beta-barrel domain n=1 Tax=Thiohalophilus thiocyanatoxydans TaxID=381308 RepID=A0A4R8IS73_9GAMM|nr:porin family protein [Thiohalophilus thiocyanatoxydans]TDY00467.1 outer membrane protein with beta-barrel domain [Thiohalophilus thiocyanatoxydans]
MRSSIKQTVLLVGLLGLALSATAVERNHSIVLKSGIYTLDTTRQTILSNKTTYEDDVDSELALEYEYRINDHVGVGVEYTTFTGNFIVLDTPGETDSELLMVNARRYFDMGQHVKPYFGGGLGFSRVEMSGAIGGDASGMGLQGMVGVEFPFDRFGLVAEYKFISSEPDDGSGEEVDLSGSGLFFGALVRF